MVLAYVGLGANLGQPRAALQQALAALDRLPQTRCLRVSSFYRSAPWQAAGPDFINAVAELHTGLIAPALLQALQALETAAGRQRPYHHAPRTLDLDLLRYGEGRIDSPALTVPHPRLQERAFVLVPLAELLPQLVSAADLARVADQAIERLA
jgi:2-amino-4-hydroxy-6-hydroxymethyldihydropteridine diphosphokinase